MKPPSRHRYGSPVVAEALRLGRGEAIGRGVVTEPPVGVVAPAAHRAAIEDRARVFTPSRQGNHRPIFYCPPIDFDVVSRGGRGAGGLPGHVVPSPRKALHLRSGPVGVHVVSRAGIDAAGLPCQVVPCPRIAGRL